ncbi:MAG: hypothetical protein ABF289_14360 [Clostridiales bacterium]
MKIQNSIYFGEKPRLLSTNEVYLVMGNFAKSVLLNILLDEDDLVLVDKFKNKDDKL